MNTYTIFYSWQSSRPEVKKAIMKSLRSVVNDLSKEGIDICLDQDTWNRVGMKRIEVEVLNKIEHCDIFIADLTPACKIETNEEENRMEKLQPNANVMFEYGYALKAKGDERMILLANLEKGEYVEQLPFDINHDTITGFTLEEGVPNLKKPIKMIIERIDEERKNALKEMDCGVFFTDIVGIETTIRPIYKRVYYTPPQGSLHVQVSPIEAVPSLTYKEAISMWAKNAGKTGSITVPNTLLKAKVISGVRNLSYSQIKLSFANMGAIELKNCHLTIISDNAYVVFKDKNEERNLPIVSTLIHRNTFVYDDKVTFHRDIINPNMQCSLEDFYVVVPHDVESFILHWSMQSTRHHQKGDLLVHVEPEYRDDCVENGDKAGEIVIDEYKEDIE